MLGCSQARAYSLYLDSSSYICIPLAVYIADFEYRSELSECVDCRFAILSVHACNRLRTDTGEHLHTYTQKRGSKELDGETLMLPWCIFFAYSIIQIDSDAAMRGSASARPLHRQTMQQTRAPHLFSSLLFFLLLLLQLSSLSSLLFRCQQDMPLLNIIYPVVSSRKILFISCDKHFFSYKIIKATLSYVQALTIFHLYSFFFYLNYLLFYLSLFK